MATRIYRILSVFIFALAYTTMSFANNKPQFKEPDFAYPKDVITAAKSRLEAADKQKADPYGGVVRLRALVELCPAEQMIDRDREFAMPALVEEQRNKEGLSDADKAMMLCYEATLYGKIYYRQRYKYDNVDAPTGQVPDDVSEWSEEHFYAKVKQLFEDAGQLADSTPLSRYESSVEYDSESLQYIPDVAGFVRYCAANNLKLFLSSEDDVEQQLAKLYNEGIASAPDGSAQFFFWSVELLNARRNTSQELYELYERYRKVEAARYVLQHIEDYGEYEDEVYIVEADETNDASKNTDVYKKVDRHIADLRESLAAYPAWYGNATLENTLKRLTQSRATVSVQKMVAQGKPFEVRVEQQFAKEVVVSLYKLSAAANNMTTAQMVKHTPKATSATIRPDKLRSDSTLTFTLTQAGYYAIVVGVDGTVANHHTIFNVTPLLGFVVNGCSDNVAGVVDFSTGAPLQGVNISLKKKQYRKGTQTQQLGKSSGDGLLRFDNPWTKEYGSYLSLTYKGQTFDLDESLRVSSSKLSNTANETRHDVRIFTDRALYHPGDTIAWAIVAATKKNNDKQGKTNGGAMVKVSLFDANYELVDSVSVRCDELGRANGAFATRKGVLTGSYSVRAEIGKDHVQNARVMVSDFKAPVFEAEITSVMRDKPEEGAVTLEGKATTYAGMPVTGASVEATIRGASRWRFFMPEKELGKLQVKTDNDGKFTITVPAQMLAAENNNGNQYTDFIADVLVTSVAAETAETSRPFTTGKLYKLETECAAMANSDVPYALNVRAYDADGKEGIIIYRWTLRDTATKDAVKSGEGLSGSALALDLAEVASGVYFFDIKPDDKGLADDTKSSTLMLYSINRNTMPQSVDALFIPSHKAAVENGKALVNIGANAPELYVYAFVRNGEEITSTQLLKLKKGFSAAQINVGSSDDDTQLILLAVQAGRCFRQEIDLEKAKAESTEIVAESFRNKLVPGSTETWRLRIAKGGKGLPDAGMIATMYDRALDALYQGSWSSQFNLWTRTAHMNILSPYNYLMSGTVYSPIKELNDKTVQFPSFRFVDKGNYVRNLMKRSYAGAYGSNDMVVLESASVTNAAMVTSAPQMTDSVAFDEEIAEEQETGGRSETDFEYRQAEVLQALWQPTLTSDADGNVDIVFTVPNANASWQFKAFAWTRTLDAATRVQQFVANKPVMVKPNLPRFLRQGDTARILATVFNNSDESAVINTTVEIFSLDDNTVLHTASSTDSIAPMASAIVAIDVEAPFEASVIGYRVRSAVAGFADGEQAAIPILASASTVIESTEFYLNPNDSKPFELTVKAEKDATLTLQYCQNPLWTIVKALRGLGSKEKTSATGAASHLFSALVAKHISDSDKNVAEAIRQWNENPEEEALVSMLARNEELKALLLEQTPWVQASKSQSQRMAALADLLDDKRCRTVIDDATKTLRELQNDDGGFAWGPWYTQSSVWTTQSVLTTLGILRSLGIETGCDNVVAPAFRYLQEQAVKAKVKTDRSLALIATLFPKCKATNDGERIIRNTVNEIVASWKKDDTINKCYDILILNGHGQKSEATKVLESVRQFGVMKDGIGLCFPNINDMRGYATIIQAYATMNAPKAEIDAMRQWITVQAQALDDLGAYNPDYIIAAVMLSGSDWTSVPISQSVSVNGRPLEINKTESATGYFSQALDTTEKNTTIMVTPNGVTPSYGSVISIHRSNMTSVESRPGRDLSIEKRCLVERNEEWVETEDFRLGERVRVQLTIKAKRNLDYVSIADERPSCFAPVEQLPGFVWDGTLGFYRENSDSSTRLFIGYLPKGTYHISYDMTASLSGSFTSGIATLQSQYAPELTAHSGGTTVKVIE